MIHKDLCKGDVCGITDRPVRLRWVDGRQNVIQPREDDEMDDEHLTKETEDSSQNGGKLVWWRGTEVQQLAALFIESRSTEGIRMPV